MRIRSIPLLLLLVLSGVACDKIENISDVPLDSIIVLQRADNSVMRADSGFSSTVVRAKIPAEAATATRTVTFRTTLGTIRGTAAGKELAVAANAQGEADITILSDATAGTAIVTATIANYVRTLEIPILPAYPDTLVAETSEVTVSRSGTKKALITVLALRANGKVTPGIPITFVAEYQDSAGATVRGGRFTGFDTSATNATGKASMTFSADVGDIPADTTVVIRVSSVNDAGAPVTTQLTVRVVE